MERKTQYRVLSENAIKVIFILVILWLAFPWIGESIEAMPIEIRGDVLIVMGLLLAGSVAGNFAFSYDTMIINNPITRYLNYTITFFLMLGIGLLLEITIWTMSRTPGGFNDPIFTTTVIVYISIILYDFGNIIRCIR